MKIKDLERMVAEFETLGTVLRGETRREVRRLIMLRMQEILSGLRQKLDT